jgi:FkbM family methyltransferase
MDIGANVGMTSILANRLFNCKIVAIEPIPCNFANLQANLGLNNCDLSKFTLINQAAASCRGNVEIDFCDFSTGNSSAYRDYGNKIVCPKCVVRELLIEHRPRYLKIDCEGAEFDFIPDLTAESLKSVEWIGIELHPATSQTPPEVLLEHLRGVCKAEIILA